MQYTTRASAVDVHGVVTAVRTLAHDGDNTETGRGELEVEITHGAIFDAAHPASRAGLQSLIHALQVAVAAGERIEQGATPERAEQFFQAYDLDTGTVRS